MHSMITLHAAAKFSTFTTKNVSIYFWSHAVFPGHQLPASTRLLQSTSLPVFGLIRCAGGLSRCQHQSFPYRPKPTHHKSYTRIYLQTLVRKLPINDNNKRKSHTQPHKNTTTSSFLRFLGHFLRIIDYFRKLNVSFTLQDLFPFSKLKTGGVNVKYSSA